MKKAVDALAALPSPPNGLKLHIPKKPQTLSDQLELDLLNYISNSGDVRVKQVVLFIEEFDLVP